MKIVKRAAIAMALSAGFVAPGAHAQTKLTIGAAGTAVASLYAAKEEGFFAKRGIDAAIVVVKLDPDMPAALYANAVDAYCTGEPFGAAAQRAGYARTLRMTRDEWRNYICCVLTVREELVEQNRPLVQDLVDHVLGAGEWLDAKRDLTVADRRK